jgi:hypothetical protein
VRYRKHDGALTTHRLRIAAYELRHLVKMLRDTPADLRHTLPPMTDMIWRWTLRTAGLDRARTPLDAGIARHPDGNAIW